MHYIYEWNTYNNIHTNEKVIIVVAVFAKFIIICYKHVRRGEKFGIVSNTPSWTMHPVFIFLEKSSLSLAMFLETTAPPYSPPP